MHSLYINCVSLLGKFLRHRLLESFAVSGNYKKCSSLNVYHFEKKYVTMDAWPRSNTPSQSVDLMTYVLLTRNDDEKTIEFPTQPSFTAHLALIRQLEPDRRWEITEEWDR